MDDRGRIARALPCVFALATAAVLVVAGPSAAREAADTTPPTIQQPANVVMPATFGCGNSFCATIHLSFTVSDPDDTPDQITVSCNVPNGTPSSYTAAAGTGMVTCQAKDAAGNLSQQVSFSVTVTVPPPSFQNVPGPISVQATSQQGAVVTFVPPTAADVGGQSDAVNCDHLSGVAYPIGTTTVTCTASVIRNDSVGNPVTFATGSAQFTITVTAGTPGGGGGGGGGAPPPPPTSDTTVPTIQPHSNLRLNATTSHGALVAFKVGAADPDNATTDLAIVCAPASGSTFALGAHAATKTTTVTCTARDPAGNQSVPMMFTVTVLGAHDQLLVLERQLISARLLSSATRAALFSTLRKADQFVLRHAPARADTQLTAFISAVGRSHAPPATRRRWNAAAARIIAVLG